MFTEMFVSGNWVWSSVSYIIFHNVNITQRHCSVCLELGKVTITFKLLKWFVNDVGFQWNLTQVIKIHNNQNNKNVIKQKNNCVKFLISNLWKVLHCLFVQLRKCRENWNWSTTWLSTFLTIVTWRKILV